MSDPDWAAIVDGVAEPGGIADPLPLQLLTCGLRRVVMTQPPIVVAGIVEQHIDLIIAAKISDPKRATVIDVMTEAAGIADLLPLQLPGRYGRVHSSQPPVVISRIVKQHAFLFDSLEVPDPEWSSVVDVLAKTKGVAN